MKKTILTFSITLSITVGGMYYYYDGRLKTEQEIVSNLEKENINKIAEIARLEDIVENKDEELKLKEGLIQEKESKLKKANGKIKELNEKMEELQSEKSLRQLNMEVTAYTSGCVGCSGITKTGVDVRNTITYQGYRIIATDPRVIPLYSIVEIKTKNKTFKAISLDTGGAIKGNIIDYLVGSYSEAIEFGRQNATITVLREGEGN